MSVRTVTDQEIEDLLVTIDQKIKQLQDDRETLSNAKNAILAIRKGTRKEIIDAKDNTFRVVRDVQPKDNLRPSQTLTDAKRTDVYNEWKTTVDAL